MVLSIVITTRNRFGDLKDCIESIKKSDITCSWELIVVDDNSTDDTRNMEAADWELKNVAIVHNAKQRMMVKSRNIGAKMADGRYVLFIDDDNILAPDMIKELVNFAEYNPEYGMIGPSMYYESTREKYLDYQKIDLCTGKTSAGVDNSSKKMCESDGIPNVFLIRKKALEKSGFFDEGLIQTYTEPDFAYNIKRFGYKCGIIKAAKTYHKVFFESYEPSVLGGKFNQKAYCLMRNRMVVISRYGVMWQKIIFIIFFSWIWPVVYSCLVLKYGKFDLMRLYWLGFKDGIIYFFTGKLRNSILNND